MKLEANSPALFTVDCWAYGSVDEPTISKALAENRVVQITPNKDGKFDVLEMCDKHFGATLTAEQLAEWGRELMTLSSAKEKPSAGVGFEPNLPTEFGYYWVTKKPGGKPVMLHLCPSKQFRHDERNIEAWECPGIGRSRLDALNMPRWMWIPILPPDTCYLPKRNS